MYEKRNEQIFKRIDQHAGHPRASALRKAAENCFAVSERFVREREQINKDVHLTREGKQSRLLDSLQKTHARDLRESRRPFDDESKRIQAIRETIKPIQVDRTDFVGAIERMEARTFIYNLPNEKKVHLLLDKNADPFLVDAILDKPAAMSGVPDQFYQQAKTTREEQLHGPLLREIEAAESVRAEAVNAATIARGDLMNVLELDQRAFDRIMAPIDNRQDAPWLQKMGGDVVVIVPGDSTAKRATPEQLRDGIYYENAEKFFEAQGVSGPDEWLAKRSAQGLAA